MIARLYIRVSTDEQARNGLSLEVQKTELINYCEDHKYTDYVLYADEGISGGSIKKRKQFQKMIEEAQQGDIILFTKLDRFSRNLLDALTTIKTLEQKNVMVKAIQQDIDTTTTQGKTMLQMMLVIAENEREMTSDRINAVFKDRFSKGYSVSGKVPLGYKKVDSKYTIDEPAANAIRDLFNYFVIHKSVRATLRWWNNKYPEYTTDYQSLKRHRLMNSIYIGIHPSGLNDHFCDPIIPVEEFHDAQNILKNNIRVHDKSRHVYLFSGLLYCGECGNKLAGNAQPRSTKEPYYVYRCNKAYLNNICTKRTVISEKVLEEYLCEQIQNIITGTISFKLEKKEPKKQKRIEDVQNKINRLNELYIDGKIDRDTYDNKYTKLTKDLDELKAKDTGVPIVSTFNTEYTNETFISLYSKLNRENKQSFWNSIIEKIIVHGNHKYTIMWKKKE